MERLQAFKFRVEPNEAQKRLMRQFAGARRFVYNKGLETQKERRARGERRLGYVELCAELKQWKGSDELQWLSLMHSQVLQQAFKDLGKAFKNFREGRAAHPRFKRKGVLDSFRYPQAGQVDPRDPKKTIQGAKLDEANARIFLPKIGWVRYRKSREVLGQVKNVTVKLCAGQWFVSIQTERKVEVPEVKSLSIEGLDWGVVRLATLSNGEHFPALKERVQRLEGVLARAQRALSRKVKFSNKWKKQKARVARLHHKIANVRLDYLHKVSHQISKNHAIVVIEDLNVRAMTASAKGTQEKPGKNVRAKAGLNRAILRNSPGLFRTLLEYKAAWRGGEVIAVNAAYTSQRCSCCGHTARENRPKQEVFRCVACGFSAHADHNAALNILAAGHAVLARRAEEEALAKSSATKREPTEATQTPV